MEGLLDFRRKEGLVQPVPTSGLAGVCVALEMKFTSKTRAFNICLIKAPPLNMGFTGDTYTFDEII